MAKRRGRGEGSILQRPDGRWMGLANLGWQNGRRRRKVVYGRTRRAVADKMVKVLSAVQQHTVLPDERVTVAHFLARWLAGKQLTMRPRAWQTYEQAIRLHLAPGLGPVTLTKLSPAVLDAWFKSHQAEGASARSIRYARTVLRAALSQARKWQMVNQNVAALVDPPRHTPKEIQPLNPEQARALLNVAKGHRLSGLLSIATALGLRIGEALGLRWSDVNLAAGTLSVCQALERSGGDVAARRMLTTARRALRTQIAATPKRSPARRHLLVQLEKLRAEWRKVRTVVRMAEPKSVRSRRTIHLPAMVLTALRSHRATQLKERLAAGGDWQDSGLVFTSPLGTPLDAKYVGESFHGLLAAAGLPLIRFHDLRHTAASLLLAQGVDPRTIMETLGHSQISLTLNTYAHILPTLKRDAADRMDAILRPRP